MPTPRSGTGTGGTRSGAAEPGATGGAVPALAAGGVTSRRPSAHWSPYWAPTLVARPTSMEAPAPPGPTTLHSIVVNEGIVDTINLGKSHVNGGGFGCPASSSPGGNRRRDAPSGCRPARSALVSVLVRPIAAKLLPILVAKVGFEPTRGCPQRCLRPPRLPFRHFALPGHRSGAGTTAAGRAPQRPCPAAWPSSPGPQGWWIDSWSSRHNAAIATPMSRSPARPRPPCIEPRLSATTVDAALAEARTSRRVRGPALTP
jgi:hypothetical protein